MDTYIIDETHTKKKYMDTLSSRIKENKRSEKQAAKRKSRKINESYNSGSLKDLKEIYRLVTKLNQAGEQDLLDHLATNMYQVGEVLDEEDFTPIDDEIQPYIN